MGIKQDTYNCVVSSKARVLSLLIKIMKHALFFLLVLFGLPACFQQSKPDSRHDAESTPVNDLNNPDTKPETLDPVLTERVEFKNYVFVLDGEVIGQGALSNYPNASLHAVLPYDTTLQGRKYSGAVLFHTRQRSVPPILYADDPAYFINGTQVSPHNIRWSRPETYNHINKSTRDTMINGKRYTGSVHVNAEEDFFAGRITLSEFLAGYRDIPPIKDIVVHWHSSDGHRGRDSTLGIVIQDHFPLYYINPKSIRSIEFSPIQFAESQKYIIHLIDDWYWSGSGSSDKWRSQVKARTIFADPLAIDTACPCYATNIDTVNSDIFEFTELKPEPYQGELVYLKKLADFMGLAPSQTAGPTIPDSTTVQFIVANTGMLTGIAAIGPGKANNDKILGAIKRHSCAWSLGMFSGRPVLTKRKITFFYSRDQDGGIRSLDSLEYL